jgi:hypothetical protein
VRRLPILDKIRLGVKVKSTKGSLIPKDVEYFVCPPKVQRVFGEKPTEIEIMFPLNSLDAIFPQSYTMYGQTKGVKCKGDGETARRRNDETGVFEDRECPCEFLEKKKCALRSHLLFMMPDVSAGSLFQIDTSSFNSTVDINSGLDFAAEMVGRFNWIPLTLYRKPRETHADGSKQQHYTLQVELRATLEEITMIKENPLLVFKRDRDSNKLIPVYGIDTKTQISIPEAIDENPALDPGATIVVEPEELNPDGTKIIRSVKEVGEDMGLGKKAVPTQTDKKEPLKKGKETTLQEIKDVHPGKQPEQKVDLEKRARRLMLVLPLEEFKKLEQNDKMVKIQAVVEGLKINMPTPAPLEEHSDTELTDLWDYICRNNTPKEIEK